MSGNAWEWVEDDYVSDNQASAEDGSATVSVPRGARRLLRSGSYTRLLVTATTTRRGNDVAEHGFHNGTDSPAIMSPCPPTASWIRVKPAMTVPTHRHAQKTSDFTDNFVSVWQIPADDLTLDPFAKNTPIIPNSSTTSPLTGVMAPPVRSPALVMSTKATPTLKPANTPCISG